MGRRYYCDHCDKGFTDNPSSRKKHLLSANHLRTVRNHYDSFRDFETRQQQMRASCAPPAAARTVCARFLASGHCEFGAFCHFSHDSQDALAAKHTEAVLSKYLPASTAGPVGMSSLPETTAQCSQYAPYVFGADAMAAIRGVGPLPPSLIPPPPLQQQQHQQQQQRQSSTGAEWG